MIELQKEKKIYTRLAIALSLLAVVYTVDILVGKMSVPIMDYWRWIAVYGQKVLDGTATFGDWFHSDAGQHIHPLSMMITFFMLKLFRFDVVPLVVAGMLLRLFVAGGLTAIFVLHFRKEGTHRPVMFSLCAVTVALSVLNFSQWEAALEPFSLAFMLRITLFYISFFLADRFVGGMDARSIPKNLLYGALLGVYSGFLTVFVSSAYFVGHLVAMGLAILWGLWCKRTSLLSHLAPVFLWGIFALMGAIVYYIIFSARADAAVSPSAFRRILPILQGIVCFWGSMLVHQTVSDFTGLAIVTAVGILLLVFALWVTFYYIRLHKDGKNLFPLMCVLYAFLTGIVIAVGRVGDYGVATMTSSRYVVESSVGLVGLAFMTYDVLARAELSRRLGRLLCISLTVSLLWLSASAVIELATMPSRRAYSNRLREKMQTIETLDDSALAEFQANSPDDVRYCVAFFKKNGLSIFKDR